jgi:hypothetical protein
LRCRSHHSQSHLCIGSSLYLRHTVLLAIIPLTFAQPTRSRTPPLHNSRLRTTCQTPRIAHPDNPQSRPVPHILSYDTNSSVLRTRIIASAALPMPPHSFPSRAHPPTARTIPSRHVTSRHVPQTFPRAPNTASNSQSHRVPLRGLPCMSARCV